MITPAFAQEAAKPAGPKGAPSAAQLPSAVASAAATVRARGQRAPGVSNDKTIVPSPFPALSSVPVFGVLSWPVPRVLLPALPPPS